MTDSYEFSFIAGSGSPGSADGTGAAASFESPIGTAISGDGRYVYVCDYGANAVRKVDVTTGAVTTIITVTQPRFVAVGPVSGNLYITYGALNAGATATSYVAEYTPGGALVGLLATDNNVTGVAVDATETTLYYGAMHSGLGNAEGHLKRVGGSELDNTGNYGDSNGFAGIWGITVGADGSIYWTPGAYSALFVTPPGGGGSGGGPSNPDPSGISIAAIGNGIWVCQANGDSQTWTRWDLGYNNLDYFLDWRSYPLAGVSDMVQGGFAGFPAGWFGTSFCGITENEVYSMSGELGVGGTYPPGPFQPQGSPIASGYKLWRLTRAGWAIGAATG